MCGEGLRSQLQALSPQAAPGAVQAWACCVPAFLILRLGKQMLARPPPHPALTPAYSFTQNPSCSACLATFQPQHLHSSVQVSVFLVCFSSPFL